MRPLLAQAAIWTLVYLAAPLLALLVAVLGDPPAPRGFWVEFGVALGFIALAMLVMQFALTARFRRLAPPVGLDAMMQFHRQAGLVAVTYALAHPVVLILAEPSFLAFYNPFDQFARAAALLFVTFALLALLVSTYWRGALGISYEWWRRAHAFLATMIVFVGLVHVQRVGHYVDSIGQRAFWVVFVGFALCLMLYTRVVKPWLMAKRPYRVSAVRRERGRSWTIALEPEGHEGMRFEAGQFVWATLGGSPYAMREHPFTIASSAERAGAFELTIKELGDATNRIGETPVGARFCIDGPHGRFTLDPRAEGFVFIAGGIGITPMMSMLRTLRDRGDTRPCTLVYGVASLDNAIFLDELRALSESMPLRLEFVPDEPPDGWAGASGMMSAETLDRLVGAEDVRRRVWYICGPEPMMDLTERWLRKRGAPLANVRAERFKIV
ncbi:MAG: oxidoreductase [Phycisphaerales bacterium]|nr:MAG: oxidoreductase [Phycisphaerales bacterium]